MPSKYVPVAERTRQRKPGQWTSDVARERIQAGNILDRFHKHFFGEIELSPTQVRVGEILLRKVIPDLAQTEITADVVHPYVIEAPMEITREEWIAKLDAPSDRAQPDYTVVWSARGNPVQEALLKKCSNGICKNFGRSGRL